MPCCGLSRWKLVLHLALVLVHCRCVSGSGSGSNSSKAISRTRDSHAFAIPLAAGFLAEPALLGATKKASSLSMSSFSPPPPQPSPRQRHLRRRPFVPPYEIRGLFVGSGSDAMNDRTIAEAVLDLVPNSNDGNGREKKRTLSSPPGEGVTVLYLGTATYDLPSFRDRQTVRFAEMGCRVTTLDVAGNHPLPSREEMLAAVDEADVIVVGGGNTLYAVDRWAALGLDGMLREAMQAGTVLTGGSAGAICWFDGGHSDSMDPATYRKAMIRTYSGGSVSATGDESSAYDGGDAKPWEYIRVSGLGLLPGLVCPHHDIVQSNGVLRAHDFDNLLRRHPGELGIGIDHWAALEVRDGRYRVISLEGKAGSVLVAERVGPEGGDCDGDDCNCDGESPSFSTKRKGVPGVWIKNVLESKDGDEEVCTRLCPPEGKVEDLLFVADEIVEDKRVEMCRKQNPHPSAAS